MFQLVGKVNISGGSTKKIAANVAIPPAVFRTIAPIASAKIPTSITYTAPPITARATPGCVNEIWSCGMLWMIAWLAKKLASTAGTMSTRETTA